MQFLFCSYTHLRGRLQFDDPASLDARSVGLRVHGTAMASLVIHGDLSEPEPPISRPLYVRPVMYARMGGDEIDSSTHLPDSHQTP